MGIDTTRVNCYHVIFLIPPKGNASNPFSFNLSICTLMCPLGDFISYATMRLRILSHENTIYRRR